MEVSLVLDTLTGYQDGEIISFYGESARVLFGMINMPIWHGHDEKYLGASLQIQACDFDILSPKALKKGYKIKIIKGQRT